MNYDVVSVFLYNRFSSNRIMLVLLNFGCDSVLLFSCLGMTAFADNSGPAISDDYQTVYLNGETYSRFNASLKSP